MIVVPALFAWLGYRAMRAQARPDRYTIRFFSDVLETIGEGYVARVSWEHVVEVKETAAGAAIVLLNERQVLIPRAQLPADHRTLIDAMPPHVRFEAIQSLPPITDPKNQSFKTVALWVVLMLAMYLAYLALGEP
jgi:hypothetical protein